MTIKENLDTAQRHITAALSKINQEQTIPKLPYAPTAAVPKVNKDIKIFLDPGHGGHDPGTINREFNLEEADLALVITKRIAKLLESYYYVAMSRREDVYRSLSKRASDANRFNADYFFSIHLNSASNPNANGFELFTSPGDTAADPVATAIYDEWNISAKRPDKSDGDPDKEAHFTVLKKTKMPAVLIEVGFISNRREANWVRDNMGLIAETLASGIHNAVQK